MSLIQLATSHQTQPNEQKQGAIAVCPGFHSPELTESFLQHLKTMDLPEWQTIVVPTHRYSPYSSSEILRYLYEQLNTRTPEAWLTTPMIFIAFSAGVVGAMGAAFALETVGGQVKALFALDGWGVPTVGRFPTHRMSHDFFTHWSSALLGAGQDSFYADPPIDHLELWRSPHTTVGHWGSSGQQSITALQFLHHWLTVYCTRSTTKKTIF